MMEDEYPAMWQFLGAYLHQDWPDDYTDPLAALDDFITGEVELVPSLREEIDRLLGQRLDAAQLEQLLIDLGSAYVPSAAGLDPREWLLQVRARLAAAT